MRNITGMRALVYTKYANKLLNTNLATPEEKRKYFEAVETLRDLADKYGEIHGIDMDSLNAKLIIK
jgi:hypothetical protein